MQHTLKPARFTEILHPKPIKRHPAYGKKDNEKKAKTHKTHPKP